MEQSWTKRPLGDYLQYIKRNYQEWPKLIVLGVCFVQNDKQTVYFGVAYFWNVQKFKAIVDFIYGCTTANRKTMTYIIRICYLCGNIK